MMERTTPRRQYMPAGRRDSDQTGREPARAQFMPPLPVPTGSAPVVGGTRSA